MKIFKRNSGLIFKENYEGLNISILKRIEEKFLEIEGLYSDVEEKPYSLTDDDGCIILMEATDNLESTSKNAKCYIPDENLFEALYEIVEKKTLEDGSDLYEATLIYGDGSYFIIYLIDSRIINDERLIIKLEESID